MEYKKQLKSIAESTTSMIAMFLIVFSVYSVWEQDIKLALLSFVVAVFMIMIMNLLLIEEEDTKEDTEVKG